MRTKERGTTTTEQKPAFPTNSQEKRAETMRTDDGARPEVLKPRPAVPSVTRGWRPRALSRPRAVHLVRALVLLSMVVLAFPPDGGAAFPGVNGKIAFDSNRDGNEEIYVINPDGTGETRLTNNPASDFSPTWSPDGTKIAFVSFRDGFSAIYIMNADGTGQTRITNNPEGDSEPDWSPNGTKIAFAKTHAGNIQIYV